MMPDAEWLIFEELYCLMVLEIFEMPDAERIRVEVHDFSPRQDKSREVHALLRENFFEHQGLRINSALAT